MTILSPTSPMIHESAPPQSDSNGTEKNTAYTESGLEVLAYTNEAQPEWDDFVDNSRNGTIFHKQQFLGYHPEGRFANASLMVRKKGKLVAVFPAAWVEDEELGWVFSSYPGSSYGGPVFSPKARSSTIEAVLQSIEQYARNEGAGAIQMRLPPHVFHTRPLAELEFFLHLHGYHIWRSELSNFVTLDPQDDDLLAKQGQNCRTAIRKALRHGLTHGESSDFESYWGILEENLSAKYEVQPTHTLAEMNDLRERFPEDIKLFAVWEGTRMIAGTVVFRTTATTAHTFYMSSRADSRHLSPMNLAIYSALVTLREQGIRAINFGVSTPQGKSVNWGLLEFKESFGGSGVCRQTYRKCLPSREQETGNRE